MVESINKSGRFVPDSIRKIYNDWGILSIDDWGDELSQQEPVVTTPTPATQSIDGGLEGLVESAIGEISNIVSPTSASAQMNIEFPEQHTVQSGDTLGAISQQYGLSLEELSSINPQIQDVNKIGIGDVINVVMPTESEPMNLSEAPVPELGTEEVNIDIEEQEMIIHLGKWHYVGSDSTEAGREGWGERAERVFAEIANGSLSSEKEENLNHLLTFTEEALGTVFQVEMETLGIDVKHIKQMMIATYAGETNVGTNVAPSGSGAVGELQVTAETFKSVLDERQFGTNAAEMINISLDELKGMNQRTLRALLTNNKEINFLVSIAKWMQLLKARLDDIGETGIGEVEETGITQTSPPVTQSKAIESIVKESIVKKKDNLFKTLGKLSRKALTEAVPDNLRFFASYLKDNNMLASLGLGRRKPVVTEEALSEGVHSVLKQAVKKAMAEGRNYVDYSDYPDTSFGMSIPAIVATAGRKSSEYADARKRYPSGWKGIAQLLMDSFDDSVAAATTIGGFQFKIENGNAIITDIYNFSRFKSKQNSAYAEVRSSVETSKGEVVYDIKANLGKLA